MNDTKKHKPCPFCGSEEVVIKYRNLYVQCKSCNSFGPSASISTFSNTQREVVESSIWDKWDERSE